MARPAHEQEAINRLRAAGLSAPQVHYLTRGGIWCALGIAATSDEDLLALPGIGHATLRVLRALFPKS